MKLSEKILIPLIVISLITAVACYYILDEYNKKQVEIKKGITSDASGETGEVIVTDADLKYEGVAILIDKNPEEETLTFRVIETGKNLDLYYNGATKILGKHGKSMTLDQILLGEILDITYSVHSGVIDTMQISQKSWSHTDVKRFSINEKARMMEIADTKYRLDESVIISYGNELANIIDVTSVDTLTVKGVGKKVYSITVDKGHGYLRLENDAYFVGGWLEVGQEIIKPISEGMLLPVPEGDYHIRVTNRGYEGGEDVEIVRDKEFKLDLSKVDIKEVAIGHIEFEIDPNFAQLYIDGQMTEFDERVALEYGVHSVRVEYPGYQTVNTNIKVSSEYADVSISLDKEGNSSSSSSSSESSSSTTAVASNTNESGANVDTPLYPNGGSTSKGATSPIGTISTSAVSGNWEYNDPIYPTTSSSKATTARTSSSSTLGSSSTKSSSSSSSDTSFISPISPINTSSSSSAWYEDSPGIVDYSTVPTPDAILDPSMDDTSSSSSPSFPADEVKDTSSSSSSSSSSAEVISQNKKMYVEEPAGVEVYLDGNYIGVAPAACNKPVGTHIIVLYKSGYTPKSYTVDIADDNNDVTFSFSELYKE